MNTLMYLEAVPAPPAGAGFAKLKSGTPLEVVNVVEIPNGGLVVDSVKLFIWFGL